jgi:hypothetical protein
VATKVATACSLRAVGGAFLVSSSMEAPAPTPDSDLSPEARDDAQRMADELGLAMVAVYDELDLSPEDRLRATSVVERELLRLEGHQPKGKTVTPSTTKRARAEADAERKINVALRDGRIVQASCKRWRDAILPAGKTKLVAAEVAALESLAPSGSSEGSAIAPDADGAHEAIMASFGVDSPSTERSVAAAPPAPRVGELGLEQVAASDEAFLTEYRARML